MSNKKWLIRTVIYHCPTKIFDTNVDVIFSKNNVNRNSISIIFIPHAIGDLLHMPKKKITRSKCDDALVTALTVALAVVSSII